MVAVLLLLSKSVSLALAAAVFVNWPEEEGVTTIVTIAAAPAAKLLREQLTGPLPTQLPCVVAEEPKVTPAGSVSVRLTLVATAGPLLVTVILYARLTFTCPGFGDTDLDIDKSMLDALTTLNVTGAA